MSSMVAQDTSPIDYCHILKRHGYDAYFVGGYVRDSILGTPSDDVDITTNAHPDKVIEIFEADGYRVLSVGKRFGTVIVVNSNAVQTEITTYRSEGRYDDKRHPSEVVFEKTLKADVSRRDFTINAIAQDPVTMEYVDYVGGLDDIASRIIRCVGDPELRFKEDPLRMLRMVRFAGKLDMSIDIDTLHACTKLAQQTEFISKERVRIELMKMMKSPGLTKAMDIMIYTGLLAIHLPELEAVRGVTQPQQYHKYTVFNHSIQVAENIPLEKPLVRLSGIFHDLGKKEKNPEPPYFPGHEKVSEEITINIMTRLKFSKAEIKHVSKLVARHMDNKNYSNLRTDRSIRRFIRRAGSKEAITDLFLLQRADLIGTGYVNKEFLTELDEFEKRVWKIYNNKPPISTKDLAINGHDLIKLGVPVGKHINTIKLRLTEEIIDFPGINNKEYLLHRAKEIYKEIK